MHEIYSWLLWKYTRKASFGYSILHLQVSTAFFSLIVLVSLMHISHRTKLYILAKIGFHVPDFYLFSGIVSWVVAAMNISYITNGLKIKIYEKWICFRMVLTIKNINIDILDINLVLRLETKYLIFCNPWFRYWEQRM